MKRRQNNPSQFSDDEVKDRILRPDQTEAYIPPDIDSKKFPSWCKWRCLYYLIAILSVFAVFSLLFFAVFTYLRTNVLKKELMEEQFYLRELVDAVNNAYPTSSRWKATFNPFGTKVRHYNQKTLKNVTAVKEYVEHIKRFFNSQEMQTHLSLLDDFADSNLPRHFDSRKRWPNCNSISYVPNQGGCGSCYAFSSIGVASDRSCIATNGTFHSKLSVQDVVGCCNVCGNCLGGDPLKALVYWVLDGVVTGGEDGCIPYAMPKDCGTPCEPSSYPASERGRTCRKECQKNYYKKPYNDDLNRGTIAYTLYPRKMTLDQSGNERVMLPSVIGHFNGTAKPLTSAQIRTIIKKELFLFGPTTMALPITEEFLHYDSGIWHPFPEANFEKRIIYWHVVRLIGWGHDSDDRLYWIAINSFGEQWGESGSFRVDTSLLERFGLEYETGLL